MKMEPPRKNKSDVLSQFTHFINFNSVPLNKLTKGSIVIKVFILSIESHIVLIINQNNK